MIPALDAELMAAFHGLHAHADAWGADLDLEAVPLLLADDMHLADEASLEGVPDLLPALPPSPEMTPTLAPAHMPAVDTADAAADLLTLADLPPLDLGAHADAPFAFAFEMAPHAWAPAVHAYAVANAAPGFLAAAAPQVHAPAAALAMRVVVDRRRRASEADQGDEDAEAPAAAAVAGARPKRARTSRRSAVRTLNTDMEDASDAMDVHHQAAVHVDAPPSPASSTGDVPAARADDDQEDDESLAAVGQFAPAAAAVAAAAVAADQDQAAAAAVAGAPGAPLAANAYAIPGGMPQAVPGAALPALAPAANPGTVLGVSQALQAPQVPGAPQLLADGGLRAPAAPGGVALGAAAEAFRVDTAHVHALQGVRDVAHAQGDGRDLHRDERERGAAAHMRAAVRADAHDLGAHQQQQQRELHGPANANANANGPQQRELLLRERLQPHLQLQDQRPHRQLHGRNNSEPLHDEAPALHQQQLHNAAADAVPGDHHVLAAADANNNHQQHVPVDRQAQQQRVPVFDPSGQQSAHYVDSAAIFDPSGRTSYRTPGTALVPAASATANAFTTPTPVPVLARTVARDANGTQPSASMPSPVSPAAPAFAANLAANAAPLDLAARSGPDRRSPSLSSSSSPPSSVRDAMTRSSAADNNAARGRRSTSSTRRSSTSDTLSQTVNVSATTSPLPRPPQAPRDAARPQPHTATRTETLHGHADVMLQQLAVTNDNVLHDAAGRVGVAAGGALALEVSALHVDRVLEPAQQQLDAAAQRADAGREQPILAPAIAGANARGEFANATLHIENAAHDMNALHQRSTVRSEAIGSGAHITATTQSKASISKPKSKRASLTLSSHKSTAAAQHDACRQDEPSRNKVSESPAASLSAQLVIQLVFAALATKASAVALAAIVAVATVWMAAASVALATAVLLSLALVIVTVAGTVDSSLNRRAPPNQRADASRHAARIRSARVSRTARDQRTARSARLSSRAALSPQARPVCSPALFEFNFDQHQLDLTTWLQAAAPFMIGFAAFKLDVPPNGGPHSKSVAAARNLVRAVAPLSLAH